MMNFLKRWAGATLVLAAGTLATGAAHGQDFRGDLWQYRHDQRHLQRDYNRLNYDRATGNPWAVQRDLNAIRRDRQELYVDRQILRDDLRYGAPSYPPFGGGYPLGGGYPPPPWGGPPAGGFAPVSRPWGP